MIWKYQYGKTPVVFVDVWWGGEPCGKLIFSIPQFEEIKAKALRASPSSPIYSFVNLDAEQPHITAENLIDDQHRRGVY